MSTSVNNAQPRPKRPVGRPKSIKPLPQEEVRDGIILAPNVSSHVLELVYNKPLNIKKIFNYFKLVDMRDIRIEFGPRRVRISGSGHLKRNFIELDIDCSKMYQYYCRHHITMVIDQRNLEKIVQKIDKSYNSIQFIAKQDGYMKELNIVLVDDSQGVKEFHNIRLLEASNSHDDDIIRNLAYKDYPLSFKIPSKYFKKVISDISKFSNEFTVRHCPETFPLSFPYDANSKLIEVEHIFSKPELFNITYKGTPDQFLESTIHIEFVQSLANALLSDEPVRVFVDHENKMVFKSILDKEAFTLTLAVDVVVLR